MEHPLKNHARGTIFHITRHYFDHIAPEERFWFPDPEVVSDADLELCERLIRSFHAMLEYEAGSITADKQPNEGVWEMVKHEFHGEAYRLLRAKDVEGFAHYMAHGCREDITYGLGFGKGVYSALTQGDAGTINVMLLKDRLASLAEALGALPFENPEQGRYGVNAMLPAEDLIAAIEEKAKVRIARAPVMGLFGLQAGSDVVDFRAIEDVYALTRVKAFGASSVAEIGAGLGGIAYYCQKAGIGSYALFDLPLVSLVQGYFLSKLSGSQNVGLYGEPKSGCKIEVLPYWEFFNRTREFDVVINRDSMAEFPRDRAVEYLREIRERNLRFLSINQESQAHAGAVNLLQLSVSELALQEGLIRQLRFPYWLREGYVEELYDQGYSPPLGR